MIVFIDDEKWIINAYIDELEKKSSGNKKYTTTHFFFPKDALEFIKVNQSNINAIILDIGMDYGDNNLNNSEPGGIQFLKNLRNIKEFKNIPVIILTVYDKRDIKKVKEIDLDTDYYVTYISRYQPDRDNVFWKRLNEAIINSYFKNK